jgi:hypothetical protein
MRIGEDMIKDENEPLEYPPYYPPKDRWKKFFIGIRWLGPDISFYKDLKRRQAARTSECMRTWPTIELEETANFLGQAFKKWLRWPTPYFLPEDRFNVIAGGPTFNRIDNAESEEIDAEIEEYIGHPVPDDFWRTCRTKTLGEIVIEILTMRKARQCKE